MRFFLPAVMALVWCGMGFSGDGLHIGYVCSDTGDTFQSYIVDAARAEAESLGVALTVTDAGEDVANQLRQVEKLLADRVDALIVVPVDTGEVADIVRLASRARAPLVFVNRNPYAGERPPDNCFVIASDAFVEGETQMRYAGPLLDSLSHVVILQGILANEASISRTKGVKEVISASYPEMAILAEGSANWRRDEARDLMRAWLREFGRERIDAVFANNDIMALGAVEALEEAGVTGVVVVGIDAIPEAIGAIQDGRMTATVLQDAVAQGNGAVKMAVDAVKGVGQPSVVILPSELVSRENVGRFSR